MLKKSLWLLAAAPILWTSCSAPTEEKAAEEKSSTEFEVVADRFADLRILRYQVPGFDQLSLDQKKLVYFLSEAALSGRDIIYDQNYQHNLAIRRALENIVMNYDGDTSSKAWEDFMVYTKRVWFSSGIHHHYSSVKFLPEFSKEYFQELLEATNTELEAEIVDIMFDPEVDAKRVNLDPDLDLVAGSANNYYQNLTDAEVDAYYAAQKDASDPTPISYGLNSQLVKTEDGEIIERVWKVGGMYGESIEKIVYWLEKAKTVAENEIQAQALGKLIEYYKTGDLRVWDEYNLLWIQDTTGTIDYINGFIETYGDAKSYKASYEAVVQLKDFESSKRMKVLMDNVQWFEDNATIMEEHKKENVTGVSYKVVNVAMESGDASPSTPIGINLPNADWIREKGSKSVSLGNIIDAYNSAGASGFTEEFAYTEEEIERAKEHGKLAAKLHTALHEVVGHASGKLNPGVGTPKETLKSYASTLEEARADLVALYFIMDPKMVELGLMETLDVGKAEYESYIRNGLMLQLRRLELGEDLEEAHMRNRQINALWAYEQGKDENVIERLQEDGKTYFVINDYERLREIFGELLKEIQRIKSEGDYEAGRALVENYGVKVDQELHAEVLERAEKLNAAPYSGFINPRIEAVKEGDEITDVTISYPNNFKEQMLYYAKNYSFLPSKN